MQHTQFNVVKRKYSTKLGTLVVVLALLAAQPLLAGTIARPAQPDPLLDGGPTVPCAAGADYASGTDANGAAVAPADVAAVPVPVPDAIAIPLSHSRTRPNSGRPSNIPDSAPNSAYVAIDGHKLAPLLNPPPCTPPAR
jgi:hypothetical protein